MIDTRLATMTGKQLVRALKGRRIVNVKLNNFRDGRGGWTCNPDFFLDDGSRLSFTVRETESGEYGIEPIRVAKVQK